MSQFIKARLEAFFDSLVDNSKNFGVFKRLIELAKEHDIGKQSICKKGLKSYPKKFKDEFLDEYPDINILAI